MNAWQTPSFVELCMNAEIGSCQADDAEEPQPPLLLGTASASDGLIDAAGTLAFSRTTSGPAEERRA